MPNKDKKVRYPLSRLLTEYFNRIGRLKYLVPIHLLFMIIICFMQSAIPRVSGFLIDSMQKDNLNFTTHLVTPFLIILLIAGIFYGALEYAQKVIASWFGVKIRAEFQLDLYRHLLHLSEDFYHRTKVGEISTRLTKDMDNGVEPFYSSICQCFWAVGMIAFSAIMLLSINSGLFFIFIATFIFWFAIAWTYYKKARTMGRELSNQYGALSAKITEGISTQELIRAFAKEKQREDELKGEIDSYLQKSLKLGKFTTSVFSMIFTVLFYFLPLLILYLSVTVFKAKLTVGEVVSVYGTWMTVAMPSFAVMNIFPWFVNCRASLDRILEFFDETPLVNDLENASKLVVTNGDIHLSNISFRYPLRDKQIVIDNLDLHIRQKEKTAIIGPTGSGKSTIISLILRLYDPEKGTVSIDNQNLKDVSQRSIRERIGIVMQDTILWSGSIRDNLRFVKPDATDESMIAALRHAELWDFIEGTTDGLDTLIGEKGVRFSGGQKQRMAIARVFLFDPPIVILDEATSALDSMTERSIQHTMNRLFEGRTGIIVAHRLSTIIDCEQIVVLENGGIAGLGKHIDLIESCPRYKQMCIEQRISAESSKV